MDPITLTIALGSLALLAGVGAASAMAPREPSGVASKPPRLGGYREAAFVDAEPEDPGAEARAARFRQVARQGRTAAMAGAQRSMNPHRHSALDREAWDMGWVGRKGR